MSTLGPGSGFIDIHSHILWGLDDGPSDLQTSVEMLRIAAETGTTDIVATPHSDLHYSFHPDRNAALIEQLSAATGPIPRIHTGCDFHLHFDNIAECLDHPAKFTINGFRYLLVEFSDLNIPPTTSQIFSRMLEAGITPVITHPERNPILSGDFGQLTSWIHDGCLIQVTAHSFLGRFGKPAQTSAEGLMARGMVHFVASDAHDPIHRPPDLSPAYSLVSQRFGVETALSLFITHPAAALTGDFLHVEMPHPPAPRRRWFSFR